VLVEDSDIPSAVTLHFKEVLNSISFSLSVTMDRYTRYYVNQSGAGEISPVYRASFRVEIG